MLEQVLKTVLTIIIVEFISINTNFNTDIMAKGAMLASTLATIFCFIYTIKDYIKIEREEIKLFIHRWHNLAYRKYYWN